MDVYYSTSTIIHLSLEDFYNAGVTPEEAREIIEGMRDCHGHRIFCQPGGVNQNWSFEMCTDSPFAIRAMVDSIRVELTDFLRQKQSTK